MQFRHLAFSQEISPRIFFSQFRQCLFPEIQRNLASHIAAESVHTLVQPETHRTAHFPAHVVIVIIQFGDIRPVVLGDSISERIPDIPVCRSAGFPHGIRRRMICHPVQYYLEPVSVRPVKEILEILHCPEFRIYGAIIGNGIIRAERSLSFLHADRIDGHEPDNVHSQFFQSRQFFCRSIECTFRSVLAHIHFVNNGIIAPFRMTGRF